MAKLTGVKALKRNPAIHVVHPQWLQDCVAYFERRHEANYCVSGYEPDRRMPPPSVSGPESGRHTAKRKRAPDPREDTACKT